MNRCLKNISKMKKTYYLVFITILISGFVIMVKIADHKVDLYYERYPKISIKDTINCIVTKVSTEYSYRERNLVGITTKCGRYSIFVHHSIYDNDSIRYRISENVEIGHRVWKRKNSDTIYVNKGDREIGFVLSIED